MATTDAIQVQIQNQECLLAMMLRLPLIKDWGAPAGMLQRTAAVPPGPVQVVAWAHNQPVLTMRLLHPLWCRLQQVHSVFADVEKLCSQMCLHNVELIKSALP